MGGDFTAPAGAAPCDDENGHAGHLLDPEQDAHIYQTRILKGICTESGNKEYLELAAIPLPC